VHIVEGGLLGSHQNRGDWDKREVSEAHYSRGMGPESILALVRDVRRLSKAGKKGS